MTLTDPHPDSRTGDHPMTTIPTDLARKRTAEVSTVEPERRTINGHVVTRQKRGLTAFGMFVGLLLAFLLAGFLLSMLQQAS